MKHLAWPKAITNIIGMSWFCQNWERAASSITNYAAKTLDEATVEHKWVYEVV